MPTQAMLMITQADIDRSIRNAPGCCPVSLAADRELGEPTHFVRIDTGEYRLRPVRGPGLLFTASRSLQDLARRFDSGETVTPESGVIEQWMGPRERIAYKATGSKGLKVVSRSTRPTRGV